MKERLPFTLEMDLLKSEAVRACMRVEEWDGDVSVGNPDQVTEINMIVSNYIHPLSVVGQLLILIRNTLEVTDVLLVSHNEREYEKDSTRVSVTVFPRFKEQPNAS
ncbi:hypothetical protein MPK66_gp166 [Erwinia phage pEa_SNUABM_2]|uniref:Uncharacterized protein n=1 Tax=Erwinia phage pEa_SNUABM_2 TaxID=2869547 RepID=A0AAE8C182_9CAUD|nr:hypothetical protein MPK66_gp166 [Erwinia phage pEa_SNUABM_2]QZE59410.1 hypothetical protein pEaSNUABM2_00166 [Erwinia phage pEa_SNUABM_2]QZE59746.1 hypothetical protein pEaSNUABM39_00166 [Erwinia phage pEa_SNUABM_39]